MSTLTPVYYNAKTIIYANTYCRRSFRVFQGNGIDRLDLGGSTIEAVFRKTPSSENIYTLAQGPKLIISPLEIGLFELIIDEALSALLPSYSMFLNFCCEDNFYPTCVCFVNRIIDGHREPLVVLEIENRAHQ